MARAGGQARYGGLVFDCAVRARPALLADAASLSAETVVRAGRVGAVNFFTKSSLEASGTRTLATHAVAMSITVWNFTFVVCQLAFLSFPSRVAVALAVDVIATLIAQDGADA